MSTPIAEWLTSATSFSSKVVSINSTAPPRLKRVAMKSSFFYEKKKVDKEMSKNLKRPTLN